MTPEFTTLMTNGLADLALASYVTVCVLGAYLWLLDGGSRYAALSGFAAGAAAWTKLEGTVACAAVLVAVLLVRRAWRTPGSGIWLAWFAVFIVPWQVFQRVHDIPANRSHFKTLYLHPLWIVDHVAHTLAETAHWGLFWPLVLGLIGLTAPLWWNTPAPASGGRDAAEPGADAGRIRHPLPSGSGRQRGGDRPPAVHAHRPKPRRDGGDGRYSCARRAA